MDNAIPSNGETLFEGIFMEIKITIAADFNHFFNFDII